MIMGAVVRTIGKPLGGTSDQLIGYPFLLRKGVAQLAACPPHIQVGRLTPFTIGIYIYMYVCMYVCIYVSMYLCIYVSMYLCIYVSMYLCIYVSMYLCNVI